MEIQQQGKHKRRTQGNTKIQRPRPKWILSYSNLCHFYVGCFIKDVNGEGRWVLIDSDKPIKDIRDLDIKKLILDSRNISRNRYAFAYTRDYSDIEINGLKIDSISSMAKVQKWHIICVIKKILKKKMIKLYNKKRRKQLQNIDKIFQ